MSEPITIQSVHPLLSRLSRLLPVLIPLLIVGSVHLNTHHYYPLNYGYDMPVHFHNVQAILDTGAMPPAMTPRTYQAHQAPLFYMLTAVSLRFANTIGIPGGFYDLAPVGLFIVSMFWTLAVALLVNRALKTVHPLLRIATTCTVLLIPLYMKMSAMFSNDLMVSLFGSLSVFVLWLMFREKRLTDQRWWLIAGILATLAGAFKNNGIIYIGVYGIAAATAMLYHYRTYRILLPAWRVILLAIVLMILPWLLNSWHTSRYLGNIAGVIPDVASTAGTLDVSVFTQINPDMFSHPFTTGYFNDRSYWSMQYVTLHGDYYNAWRGPGPQPPETQPYMHLWNSTFITVQHYNDALTLQYMALPITAIMLFAPGATLVRLLRTPGQALMAGDMVIIAFAIIAQAALIYHMLAYQSIRAAHARYAGFLYGLLLIVGIERLWHMTDSGTPASKRLRLLLIAILTAYSLAAIRFIWLPPG